MTAIAQWQEDNGTATGSPAKGATRNNTNNVNWKSVDDTTTSPANATILAGTNSYPKYTFVKFTGTFNQLSMGRFAHAGGSVSPNTKLVGLVTSTYTTPTRGALAGAKDLSNPVSLDNGEPVKFAPAGPEGTAVGDRLTMAGYTQYMVTQLQTTGSAQPGDTPELTLAFRWNEN
jgi:hypothetical protein